MDNQREYYLHKISSTYKCRINAAERLKGIHNIILFFNIYYSAMLAIYSIYSLIMPNSSRNISIMTTVASVLLLIFITFINSKAYGERAKALKDNYILLGDLKNILKFCDECDIEEVVSKYKNLLQDSENHSEIDYYKYKVEDKTASHYQKCCYYLSILARDALIIAFFVIPLILNQVSKFIILYLNNT